MSATTKKKIDRRRTAWDHLSLDEKRERTAKARAASRASATARWVERMVERAPELTDAQRDTIAHAIGRKA